VVNACAVYFALVFEWGIREGTIRTIWSLPASWVAIVGHLRRHSSGITFLFSGEDPFMEGATNRASTRPKNRPMVTNFPPTHCLMLHHRTYHGTLIRIAGPIPCRRPYCKGVRSKGKYCTHTISLLATPAM